jgi:hypothetical protein
MPQRKKQMKLDISTLNQAEVLAALYNASKVQGMGFLQAREGLMTTEEAQALLNETNYFDYVYGKVMKLDFSRYPLCVRLYDRDNGEGAAMRALQPLFDKK